MSILSILGLGAGILSKLFKKGKGTDILSMLSGALSKGAATKAMSKKQRAEFFERIGMLKPQGEYSMGKDPQLEAMMSATARNRGIYDPFGGGAAGGGGGEAMPVQRPANRGVRDIAEETVRRRRAM